MLMQWGPFMFAIPTYSVEQMSRAMTTRVQSQSVIGARPPTHRLGPGEETLTLNSTFYPYHFNGNGLRQLDAIRDYIANQQPHILLDRRGRVHGLFICTRLDEDRSMFSPLGDPQEVTVNMSMTRYVGGLSGSIPGGLSLDLPFGSITLGF